MEGEGERVGEGEEERDESGERGNRNAQTQKTDQRARM